MQQSSYPLTLATPLLAVIAAQFLLVACKELVPGTAANVPAAATPTSLRLYYIPGEGDPFTEARRTPEGKYNILPNKGFRLSFDAPWPLNLKVTLADRELKKRGDFPQGTPDSTLFSEGYFDSSFDLHSNEPQPAMPTWTLTVSFPDALHRTRNLDFSVRTVSLNNNLTGTEKLSGPATITLTERFAIATPGPSLGNCPTAEAIAGYRLFGPPLCDAQITGASLTCDPSGYYCCAPKIGASGPRCGAGQQEFQASCNFGIRTYKMLSSGCYEPL